jgi:hypothetical protein
MTAAEKELRQAHVELRAAIRVACKRIKDLTPHSQEDPALPTLRRVWEQTRLAGR